MRKFDEEEEKQKLELLKAVAQAWHAHTGEANLTNECDARRAVRSPLRRPSRFKLEAATANSSWDFSRSLWDSYEIVTMAKQLEACNLGLDQPMPRRRESKNSLRVLLHKGSPGRSDKRQSPGVQEGRQKS